MAALHDKLIASDRRLQDASDLKVLKQHASTRSLIERDRENHRLGLAALSELPQEYAKEVLAAACRQLKARSGRDKIGDTERDTEGRVGGLLHYISVVIDFLSLRFFFSQSASHGLRSSNICAFLSLISSGE